MPRSTGASATFACKETGTIFWEITLIWQNILVYFEHWPSFGHRNVGKNTIKKSEYLISWKNHSVPKILTFDLNICPYCVLCVIQIGSPRHCWFVILQHYYKIETWKPLFWRKLFDKFLSQILQFFPVHFCLEEIYQKPESKINWIISRLFPGKESRTISVHGGETIQFQNQFKLSLIAEGSGEGPGRSRNHGGEQNGHRAPGPSTRPMTDLPEFWNLYMFYVLSFMFYIRFMFYMFHVLFFSDVFYIYIEFFWSMYIFLLL